MADLREQRIVNNEALFRAANERMANWDEQHTENPTEPYYCECADRSCREKVWLHEHEYEAVRAQPHHFFVVSGHEIPDVEAVIEDHGEWVVVEKNPSMLGTAISSDIRRQS